MELITAYYCTEKLFFSSFPSFIYSFGDDFF